MDERKIRILNAIINSYIETPIPVGSRKISKEYNLGVSSATIRNEMSDLEDLGYLNKPHTSAGRIPSDKAYRFYVDEWLQDPIIDSKKFDEKFLDIFQELLDSPEQLFAKTARFLSEFTNYTSYVLAPKKQDTILKYIELFPLEQDLILVIMIGNLGVVEKSLIRLPVPISIEQLEIIELQLNRSLTGINFSEIGGLKLTISGELSDHRDFISKIVELAYSIAKKVDQTEIYIEGLINILNFEEYQDVDKARRLLTFLEDEKNVLKLFPQDITEDGIQVIIGSENAEEIMKENSLISSTYRLGQRMIGQVGLIGPVRMDYIPMIQLLENISSNLTELMRK